MRWKAVLFDMDGVLIESEALMAKTGVKALKKFGIEAKAQARWWFSAQSAGWFQSPDPPPAQAAAQAHRAAQARYACIFRW